MWGIIRWGLAVLAVACFALPAQARRLALVVGNNNYQHAEKLRNATNDADAMTRALQAAGFEVTARRDLGRTALFETLDRFVLQLQKNDEVVFYFAGHGVQIDSAPYLLPIDLRPDNARQVARESLPLDTVMTDLSKARYALLIIDACRTNPFATQGRRAIGGERGLQPVEPPEGVAVILAAGRGQAALDSLGPDDKEPNGVFTRQLIKQMAVPGVPVRDILLGVRDEVEQLAARVSHKQRPALIDESRGQFYFHAPTGRVEAPGPANVETAYWNSMQGKGGEELRLYLQRYPTGRFADLALTRLAAQDAGQTPPSATASPATPPVSTALASALAAPLQGDPPVQRALMLAEKGNAAAMASVGSYYFQGRNGMPRDLQQALAWYRKAADAGSGSAQAALGLFHERGFAGLKLDLNEAVEFYRRAAEDDDPEGMNHLGRAYALGLGGVDHDDESAIYWFRKAAAAGLARAITNLGWCYANGRGVARDDVEAVRLFQQGMEVGDPSAMSALGAMHEGGRGGLARNEQRAAQLYREAAERREPSGMLNLAVAYLNGAGVPRDNALALEWLRKAIDEGEARAKSNLGYLYAGARGGMPKDEARAMELFREAAAQGDALGMNLLGEMYSQGSDLLGKDESTALEWYRRAAALGLPNALYNLGVFHRDGRGGLRKDLAQARSLFELSASLGFDAARIELRDLK